MNHYVYQIISLTPNEEGVCRIYSGLRSCECLPEEDDYMGSGIAIKRAIAKYGKEKFMKLIIAKFDTREAAHDCETAWLEKQFNFHGRDWTKFNKFHYNLRLNENDNGGNFHSPEAREKISAANSGENHPFFGKQHSEETREKISAANIGENNPFFGKQHSEETREKISAANSGENNPFFGKQHSEETRQKIGEAKIGENHHNFKGLTIGTNRDNHTIVFCGKQDMHSRGFDPSAISKVINGKRASHKGFTFIRTDDPDQLRELLNTAEFYDDVSKQRIEEFLSQ